MHEHDFYISLNRLISHIPLNPLFFHPFALFFKDFSCLNIRHPITIWQLSSLVKPLSTHLYYPPAISWPSCLVRLHALMTFWYSATFFCVIPQTPQQQSSFYKWISLIRFNMTTICMNFALTRCCWKMFPLDISTDGTW